MMIRVNFAVLAGIVIILLCVFLFGYAEGTIRTRERLQFSVQQADAKDQATVRMIEQAERELADVRRLCGK